MCSFIHETFARARNIKRNYFREFTHNAEINVILSWSLIVDAKEEEKPIKRRVRNIH